MKMMKKLATLLLAICLVIPCFSMVSFAADGKIMFTDPSTKVGETLEVAGVVQKSAGTLGKIEIVMTYDTSYLKFKSGDGVAESEGGKIAYTADATNDTGSRKEFKIVFDVLKEGTTKLEIVSATIKNVSGTVMNYTKGSSKITIAAGDPTTNTDPDDEEETPGTVDTDNASVEIAGKLYTFSNEIPENEIPEGYTASQLEYDLKQYNVVYSEAFQLYLAYMIGADGAGQLFMYVEEDATFAPYAEIKVSDEVRIALLTDVSEIVLPKKYIETEVVLEGQAFPAWKVQGEEEYFIMYAVNNRGEKSLYQLDNAEKTYQRFVAPNVIEDDTDDSFIGRLSAALREHMDYVILATGLGFLLFIIIIVILSVKLYNRNAELDEIYDEYGLDEEDEENKDDEEDDYDDYDDEEELNEDKEMELFVQEGMKEVFPEVDGQEEVEEAEAESETEKVTIEEDDEVAEMVVEPVKKESQSIVEISVEKTVEKVTEEGTLGDVLAKQKEEFYDDDEEDVFENFSMDFIDLDD